jgi:hypothetical protein
MPAASASHLGVGIPAHRRHPASLLEKIAAWLRDSVELPP